MNRLLLLLALVFAAVPFASAEDGAPAAAPAAVTPQVQGLVIDTNKVVGGRVELRDSVGRGSAQKKTDKIAARKAHAREDICLRFADETLTWGDVEDYVDLQLLEAPLNIPPQATVEQVNQIIASSKIRLEEVAINSFLREAILAREARKQGLSVSDEELDAALKKATAKSARKRHGAEIVPKLLDKKGYFARNQRNYLLTRKYREMVLEPGITASSNELAAAIVARRQEISDAIETNRLKRVEIEGFLKEIKAGKRDFGETAYEFSDCGSCMDNGDWGEFEADNCSLLQPLKDFIFAPSKAEMSEIIETPYSYHIVKILQRFYDKDEDTDTVGQTPADAAAEGTRGPVFPCAGVLVAALVASLVIYFGLRKKSVILCALAHMAVWGGAVLLTLTVCRTLRAPAVIEAPTRVHVAHIMLEKETVPPELDEAAALQEVRAKKLGLLTIRTQQKLLEQAQADGTLACDVRITLLNKVKMIDRRLKEKGGRT